MLECKTLGKSSIHAHCVIVKVLSELTYGNLVMTCLHTVISSAFHPYFLGLTMVPIMSVIVNVLRSLLCSNDRHMVVLFAGVA